MSASNNEESFGHVGLELAGGVHYYIYVDESDKRPLAFGRVMTKRNKHK